MLEDDAVTNKIIACLCKGAAIPASGVTTATTFEELGLDSLDVVQIAFELEDAFQITIETEQFDTIKTVSDLVQIVVDGVKQNQIETTP